MVLFWPHIWQEYIRWEWYVVYCNVFKRNFGKQYRIPIALISLHFNELIWRFQLWCSSKITPRYLTLLQVVIFCSLILKFRCFVICFYVGLNKTVSALLVLRHLFVRNHWQIKARSWFIFLDLDLDFKIFFVNTKFVSSA